jgi:hypothetical protein
MVWSACWSLWFCSSVVMLVVVVWLTSSVVWLQNGEGAIVKLNRVVRCRLLYAVITFLYQNHDMILVSLEHFQYMVCLLVYPFYDISRTFVLFN